MRAVGRSRYGYFYRGCYTNDYQAVMMYTMSSNDMGMTIERCAALARASNYAFFAIKVRRACVYTGCLLVCARDFG